MSIKSLAKKKRRSAVWLENQVWMASDFFAVFQWYLFPYKYFLITFRTKVISCDTKQKGLAPKIGGQNVSKSLFNISFYLSIIWYKYKKQKGCSWQSQSIHIKIEVICYVLNDIRDQNSKYFTSYISKTANILKNIIEQKLHRIMLSTRCPINEFKVSP